MHPRPHRQARQGVIVEMRSGRHHALRPWHGNDGVLAKLNCQCAFRMGRPCEHRQSARVQLSR
jgi:hypothetical protein